MHASVVAGVLNQKTIVMDQSSDITLTTRDPFGSALPSIGYTVAGGRILGVDPGTGASVLGLNQVGTTDASGEVEFVDESYGQYTVTTTSADYEFYKLVPESADQNQFTATAGTAANVAVILLDKNIGSLKVQVLNQADSTPLMGAEVQLENTGLAYDVTLTTDQYGYVYFPATLPELSAGTYDLSVTLTGYGDETDTVTINGALVSTTLSMTAN